MSNWNRMDRADDLIESAVAWLTDITADESTRDGEPPSDEAVTIWLEGWLEEAREYLKENNDA